MALLVLSRQGVDLDRAVDFSLDLGQILRTQGQTASRDPRSETSVVLHWRGPRVPGVEARLRHALAQGYRGCNSFIFLSFGRCILDACGDISAGPDEIRIVLGAFSCFTNLFYFVVCYQSWGLEQILGPLDLLRGMISPPFRERIYPKAS